MLPPELVLPVTACAIAAAACWLLSLIFGEVSWVDRLWSITPPVYVVMFAAAAGGRDARLDLMAALTVLWGARLTFNFARKGGYAKGGEDYRWAVLRARMKPAAWHLFNLGFIAGYQNVLLLLIALPAWTALGHPAPLGPLDVVAAAGFLILLAGETWADQQQWRFHQAKKARAAAGEPEPTKGFVDTGLWAWSRHPNFFCEQGLWWMIYLFAVSATGAPLHITIAGPVLLTLLFQGSTSFTESITASRYPAYAEYQRRVSRLIPMPPR
jgi:steroid 5-alpha reductase family enzyme